MSHSEYGFPSLSPRAQLLQERLLAFMNKYVYPAEEEIRKQHAADNWGVPPKLEELKALAKAEGLWNLFLPVENDNGAYGAGLTNLEYAPLCEIMGRLPFAPEVFNCAAPDTGNMEIIARFGTEEQKKQWLVPLLEGKIRSCFGMTEPEVASSDASNIQATITRSNDEYIINGRKWWTSGAGDPRCKLCVFMGKSSTQGGQHGRQSMILVPMDSKGVKIIRPLTVFGYDDAPHGHMEVVFENVRVPVSNMLLGEGRGFEIAQARLGPGRIHHCMRAIGCGERMLEALCARAVSRVAFGKPLAQQGTVLRDIADSRMELDQARLYVMHAAHKMDRFGNKIGRTEIHAIKVVVPNIVLRVIDRAIQVHGGAGVCQDFPLAYAWAMIRTLRIADGPDEVHRVVVAQEELKRQASARKARL
eukprot:c1769_g1_i1.p1 GENE.c1769_g1_i1~~c1769_g1_i1.p1  ORF type:complete len:417 (-),score=112.26 c1769_g1_i1:152-1402(-)